MRSGCIGYGGCIRGPWEGCIPIRGEGCIRGPRRPIEIYW